MPILIRSAGKSTFERAWQQFTATPVLEWRHAPDIVSSDLEDETDFEGFDFGAPGFVGWYVPTWRVAQNNPRSPSPLVGAHWSQLMVSRKVIMIDFVDEGVHFDALY